MSGMSKLQAMALAAMAMSDSIHTGGFACEEVEPDIDEFFRPSPAYTPSSGPHGMPTGPKGGWDKCVAYRQRKLDSRKRERQARRRQRGKR